MSSNKRWEEACEAADIYLTESGPAVPTTTPYNEDANGGRWWEK